jgi:putative restriction endonuclease
MESLPTANLEIAPQTAKFQSKNWTREQTIIALNLYCKIPFNRVTSTNPEIIKFSKIIGRSTNSLKMKIGNFGSFDPELKRRGIVGLSNVSKLDRDVWHEFNNDWENLAFESEKLIADFSNTSLEKVLQQEITEFPLGQEKQALIRARVNQTFFRSAILSSYNSKCCITGLSIPSLLVASHIIPWSINQKERLNPRNGLCLNSIHDKAFDNGLLTVTTDYKIKLSKYIQDMKSDDVSINHFFLKYEDISINLPDRFLPEKDFLDFHYQNIFKR